MPKRIKLEISEEQRTQLERWIRNPPRPYLRERARAILRVGAGETLSSVAEGLRTPVHRTTVKEWVDRFRTEGLAGLKIKPGRGRKAAFSPPDSGGSPRADRDGPPAAATGVPAGTPPLAAARSATGRGLAGGHE